eukprot:SAG31_NODE_241_length_19364_cov_17.168544_14_plen_846_part_01
MVGDIDIMASAAAHITAVDTDTNGCEAAPYFDHPDVQCHNVPASADVGGEAPSFTCDNYPSGFTGDGQTCCDIDDCLGSPCGEIGVVRCCIDNGAKAYSCECSDGYIFNDGVSCTDLFAYGSVTAAAVRDVDLVADALRVDALEVVDMATGRLLIDADKTIHAYAVETTTVRSANISTQAQDTVKILAAGNHISAISKQLTVCAADAAHPLTVEIQLAATDSVSVAARATNMAAPDKAVIVDKSLRIAWVAVNMTSHDMDAKTANRLRPYVQSTELETNKLQTASETTVDVTTADMAVRTRGAMTASVVTTDTAVGGDVSFSTAGKLEVAAGSATDLAVMDQAALYFDKKLDLLAMGPAPLGIGSLELTVPNEVNGFLGGLAPQVDGNVNARAEHAFNNLDTRAVSTVAASVLEDDFKANFVHVAPVEPCCLIIGIIVILVLAHLVSAYGDACEQQKWMFRPTVCIPRHTKEARTSSSKSCDNQSWIAAWIAAHLRKRRWGLVPMRQKWSKLVLGGLLFGLLMFQPVVEGSAAAAVGLTAKATIGADRRNDTVHRQIDMSQLAALDIDLGLKQFLGEMVAGFQVQVHQLKKGDEALETMLMKESQEKIVLREENRALKTRVAHLESVVVQLTNESATQSRHLTTEVENIAVRLDQCKEETLSFVTEMERRRMQDVDICQGSGLSEMFTACCPNHGGHRRSLQDHGCDALPETCPGTCAPLFIEFFQDCRETINSLTPAEQQEFAGFYADCTEMAQQQAAISDGAKPALMFHMVVIDQEAEQQEAALLDPSSALGPPPTLGPVQLPPVDPHTPLPPTTQPDSGAVQEFQRVCSRANLTVCAPQCNPV